MESLAITFATKDNYVETFNKYTGNNNICIVRVINEKERIILVCALLI